MISENVQVSVVIPTYNRAPYVTMAIESALAQSYQDYEIIVVDDGSTDGTRDVLEPYRDRIRYMYQDNKGVSAARNTGIQESRGEWIAFLCAECYNFFVIYLNIFVIYKRGRKDSTGQFEV